MDLKNMVVITEQAAPVSSAHHTHNLMSCYPQTNRKLEQETEEVNL